MSTSSISLASVVMLAAATAAGGGLSWKVEYNDQDRLARSIDPGGRVTKYTYRSASGGPLESVTQAPPEGPAVTWRFGAAGRLAAMTDGQGDVAYRYDSRGRLEAVERKGAPAIRYGYDAAGRIAEVRIGDFYRVAWTYDFLGRLVAINTPAGQVRYEYQTGQGMTIRSLPNGVKTFWKHQPNGQLEEITHGFFKNATDKRYSVLAQYKYEQGPDGRISAILERSPKGEVLRRYKYDTMGRLIAALGSDKRNYRYEYDLVGNRTKATATGRPDQACQYYWAGRLTSVNGKPCRYDDCGNLTEVTLDGVTRKYGFHPSGQLAEARVGQDAVKYRYDGFGRLIARKTVAGVTRFIPDPRSPNWQPLIMEEPGDKRTLVIWDGPVPLATIRDGKAEWLLHDHLGSVRLVTDAKGEVAQTFYYGPFGSGESGRRHSTPVVPGFTGLLWDGHAHAYLARARGFVPRTGRFLQPDPQRRVPTPSPEDCSPYSYCGSDPINLVDLNGADASKPVSSSSHDRWWEVFRHVFIRNMVYDTIGGPVRARYNEYRLVHNGLLALNVLHGRDPLPPAYGPAVNLDPPERDHMISAVIKEAKKHGTNPQELHGTLKTWRENPAERPQQFVNSLTGHEWKVLENAAYSDVLRARTTRDVLISDGHVPGFIVNWIPEEHLRAPAHRLLVKAGTLKWGMAHAIGELSGVPPAAFDHRTRGEWETNTRATWIAYDEGLAHWDPSLAGSHNRVVKSPTVAPKTLWQRIDDFLCPPAYGDEIPAGILASTTGPGKRGGRGGGITRPPGWPRPPGPQGNPPPGPQPKPGGKSPLGGKGFGMLGETSLGMSPSTVGGVYLGGAGGSIEGLGMLKGVRVDTNGNIVLVAEDAGDVKLPPLRLDDLVTVFRSVYIHGEGPSVTINPNPENPEKSAMVVVHGKGTHDTYVGWVLFQADRLMKGYTLGVDNVTAKDVVSKVPGYAALVDKMYFGGDDRRKAQKEGIWERFWIVPAKADRFIGSRRALTIFDLPLKVRTQKMKWVNDELVDDPGGKSSPGALAFTQWFTRNYSGVTAEQYLMPPKESGMTKPVPVYAELRRIALMTAIAEKLNAQGVPMPFWMRDYEVRSVPVDRFTPGMEVTRKNATVKARIFGGVDVGADDKVVKTYSTLADAEKAPTKEARREATRGVKLADRLERAVAKAVSPVAAAPLSMYKIVDDKREYRAVSLPGAKTLALGACRLDEVDLAVPVVGGAGIRLVRSFNSFFNTKGPWGPGWTMDLPRLQEIRVLVSRENGRLVQTIGYELLTPYNSIYARFRKARAVAGLKGAKLMVPDKGGPFHGLGDDRLEFLKDAVTRVLLLKNGQKWHFTRRGHLVAVQAGPQVTVYERRADGQVSRIVALMGGAIAGRIDLEYTSQGSLRKGTGISLSGPKPQKAAVGYAYDTEGRLSGVDSSEGAVGYAYRGRWVSSITWTDKKPGSKASTLAAFEYNDRGQLVSETGGGQIVRYGVSPVAGGLLATEEQRQDRPTGGVRPRVEAGAAPKDPKDAASAKAFVRYDSRMRPIEAVEADGTRTAWSYKPDGGVESVVSSPDKRKVIVTDSADGRQRTVRGDGGAEIDARFDEAGRLTRLSEGKQEVLRKQWRSDGQLSRVETAAQGITFRYGDDAVLSSVMLRPPGAGAKHAQWQETKVDRRGRPVEVRDNSGLRVSFGYDVSGMLCATVQETPDGNWGWRAERDKWGRVRTVKSSWGVTSYAYAGGGDLNGIKIARGKSFASVELSGGLIRRVTGFDNGVTAFRYNDAKGLAGSLGGVKCANGLDLRHEYDDKGRLTAVAVGADRRVRLGYDARGRIVAYLWEPVTP